jgi:succinate dehydrogenase/fumarate reductase flavoprotein subunit
VRTADRLTRAAAEAAALPDRLAALPHETLGELIARIELEQLALVGQACAASALLRTESRAAHYREDFPATDPAWLSTVLYDAGRAHRRPLTLDSDEERRLSPSAAPAPARPDEFVE